MAIQLSEQNKAMLAVLAAEVIKQQKPEMQAMVRDMCAQLSSPMAPATGGGSFSPLLTPVFAPNQDQNGNSMGGSNGCGCSIPGAKPNGNPGPMPPVPALPPQACGIPNMPAVGGGSLPIGTWNCEQVQRDLAACTVAKIMREEKLPTVTGDLAGAIAAGETIAAEFAPIGVSHSLCVDFVRVTISDGGDPPVVITVPIAEIGLQGEIIVQNPDGTYAHAWDFADPERPSYLGVTDGRCRCEFLCVCVSADGHARLTFTLPEDVELGETLSVEIWGRRKEWGRVCGPCPPCLICDHTLLTSAEEAAVADVVYVVP